MDKMSNINWVDGMKINKTHFIHNDKLQRSLLRDANRTILRSYNYGLLHNEHEGQKPNVYKEDDYVILHHCDAITRDGTLIHIGKEHQLKFDLKDIDDSISHADELLILVYIDEDKHVAHGVPDPQELPPRQPFVDPLYGMTVIPTDRFGTAEFANRYVSIGRLKKNLDSYELDEKYLPPCHEVLSHVALLDQYLRLEDHLGQIGTNAAQVVQNARSKKKRGEINDLAENTFYLMEKLVFFLAENMNQIRTLYKEESPIYLFSFLNSLGRLIYTSLRCIKSVDREALLRYYESHLGMQPHMFESEIKALSQLEYDHHNLNEIFQLADKYLLEIRDFVSKAVNLEYHSVERVDVINEKVIKKNKLDIF